MIREIFLDHQAVFLQSKIEGHAIFKIAGINSDSYIAGNLEVVESILKRGISKYSIWIIPDKKKLSFWQFISTLRMNISLIYLSIPIYNIWTVI